MTEATPSTTPGVLRSWRATLATGNPPRGVEPAALDPVSRWFLLTRAAVLPMTLTAGLLAGLLAVGAPGVDWRWWALAVVGILLAHMANNLMNDLFDLDVGNDDEEYPRALYAPHPVLSGLTTRRGLILAAVVVNLIDVAICAVLLWARGWPIVAFAAAGFVLSYAYTAPPLRLKRIGLGELDVFLTWGPLMVGGCYFAATGTISWSVFWASVPYALLTTAVLMGKHVDKADWDRPKRTYTLPVLLGDVRARLVTRGLFAGFYIAIAVLVATSVLPWPSLLALAALPRLARVWRAFRRPAPAEPPRGYPIWPLWFAPHAFVFTRLAGLLFVAGLAVGVAFDLYV
ncbi:MAG: prenyltransferase [Acidimicrobiia bacterium]|nr:prenyltransferase [Acidimicrobiia bacterium]